MHFFVPKICTYQKKAVPLQRQTKKTKDMKQTAKELATALYDRVVADMEKDQRDGEIYETDRSDGSPLYYLTFCDTVPFDELGDEREDCYFAVDITQYLDNFGDWQDNFSHANIVVYGTSPEETRDIKTELEKVFNYKNI